MIDVDRLPIPSENGVLVQAKVTSVGDDWTLAWAMEGGRRVEPFGETFRDVRRACRVAARINARASS